MLRQPLRTPLQGLLMTTLAVGLAAGVASAAQGAGDGTSARFEVASVKPSPDPRTLPVMVPDGGTLHPGGRWTAAFVSLRDLIRRAYPGHDFTDQIVGGPSWVDTDRYHIDARTLPDATAADVPAMLRALLAERFALQIKTDMREMRGYELVRARQDGRLGPGLRTPEVNCDEYRAARQRGEPVPSHLTRDGDRLPCVAILIPDLLTPDYSALRLTAGGAKIADLLVLIGRQVGRPVVDRTGLMGVYDVEVKFAAPRTVATTTNAGPTDNAPAIFEALQEQAGLKLNDSRLTVEVLAIERAIRATEN
jgi:uncharacterized protein (TIGR03435 family)